MTGLSAESLPLGPGATPTLAGLEPQGGPRETGGERRRTKHQKIKVGKKTCNTKTMGGSRHKQGVRKGLEKYIQGQNRKGLALKSRTLHQL